MAQAEKLFVEPGPRATPASIEALPLIERWWITPDQAARRLSSLGLGDPFTWCRTTPELSTGQRERLRVLDLIHGTPGLIVLDEFTTGLDRLTARAVAWAVGRALRRDARQAIIATCHDDIADDLSPDLLIKCNWSPTPQISEPARTRHTCSIMSDLIYRPGTRADWNALKKLHYAAGDPATFHSIHTLWVHDKNDDTPNQPGPHDQLAAVAVLSWPDLHSAARNLATNDAYVIQRDGMAVHTLNREVLKLTRIVVTPELRGCGVAQRLLQHVLTRTTAKWIECSTALGRFSNFLIHAGFKEVPQGAGSTEAALLDWATREKVPPAYVLDPTALEIWSRTLSVRRQRAARQMIWKHYFQFVLHRRTRAPLPAKIPGPRDPHWPEAWRLAAVRLQERPTYFIIGPLAGTEVITPCQTQNPPNQQSPTSRSTPPTSMAGTPEPTADPGPPVHSPARLDEPSIGWPDGEPPET